MQAEAEKEFPHSARSFPYTFHNRWQQHMACEVTFAYSNLFTSPLPSFLPSAMIKLQKLSKNFWQTTRAKFKLLAELASVVGSRGVNAIKCKYNYNNCNMAKGGRKERRGSFCGVACNRAQTKY